MESIILSKKQKEYILDDYSIVICQTNKKGKNVESKLNLRIAECERAFDVVKDNFNLKNLCSIPQKYMRMITFSASMILIPLLRYTFWLFRRSISLT